MLNLGVVFPQTEIGSDPDAIRAYAEAIEGAGYTHLVTYDHVLGASPDRPGGWSGSYTFQHAFHEPLVLFGYLAGCTRRIGLVTGILVLPQRQAALVAKQAAEVDLLSGGRLRLGVARGWNAVEYEALGVDFQFRGRRLEEQVALLRELWAKPLVNFVGEYHRVSAAGLNPLPGRQIPIWLGTTGDAGLRRAARIADGWISEHQLGSELEHALRSLRSYLEEAGRDPTQFGIEGEVMLAPGRIQEALSCVRAWDSLGATDVSLTTMNAGLVNPSDHVELLLEFKQTWDGMRV